MAIRGTFPRRVCVLDDEHDYVVKTVGPKVAQQMLDQGYAVPAHGHCIRMQRTYQQHRTYISNGQTLRQACGMSQVYTRSELANGKVDDFKEICRQDVRVFYAAIIECSV